MLSHENIARLEEIIKLDPRDARYRVLKTMDKAGGMARCLTKGLPEEDLFQKTIDFMVCCVTNILQFNPTPDWEEMIERLSLEPSDTDTLSYNIACAGAETGKMLEGVTFHYQRFDAEKIVNHSIGGLMPAIVLLRLMKKTDEEIRTAFRASCERWAKIAAKKLGGAA